MTQVISFARYYPPIRYDEIPWTDVQVEEASDQDGPWSLIDTLALSPVDTNPARPVVRNITTEQASDDPNLWYRLIFLDATNDTSQPSDPVQNLTEVFSTDYITREHLKATLEMSGLSFADDDMDSSISAASRAVDFITNRRFWLDSDETTRTFIPRWSRVELDDVTDVSAVTGSGSALTEGTDYMLLPLNAPADGKPYSWLQFLASAVTLPDFSLPSLDVTGVYGWPAIPDEVVTATTILATRILRRQREAPFGIVTVGIEQGAVARIASTDPDVNMILDNLVKGRVLIA